VCNVGNLAFKLISEPAALMAQYISMQSPNSTFKYYLPVLIIAALGVCLTLIVANSAWNHEGERASAEIQRRISAHFRALQHGITGRIRRLESTGTLLSASGGRASIIFPRVAKKIGVGTKDGPWAVFWFPSIDKSDQSDQPASSTTVEVNTLERSKLKAIGQSRRQGGNQGSRVRRPKKCR
jgi:hypothetical protein